MRTAFIVTRNDTGEAAGTSHLEWTTDPTRVMQWSIKHEAEAYMNRVKKYTPTQFVVREVMV